VDTAWQAACCPVLPSNDPVGTLRVSEGGVGKPDRAARAAPPGLGAGGGRRQGRAWGSVALSLCTTAHPLYTGIANIFGASIPEATMRPNPRSTWRRSSGPRARGRPWRCRTSGLLTQGVPGVPQDPSAPRRGPLGSSPDRESAIGNAPALVPGPVARLQDLQPLTEFSPQVPEAIAKPVQKIGRCPFLSEFSTKTPHKPVLKVPVLRVSCPLPCRGAVRDVTPRGRRAAG
jgi:hypothetical protein